jgi:rhodanese-related sulfurtransferase
MQSFSRILIIFLFSFTIGLIYNQFVPTGIKWQLLVPSNFIDTENNIPILSADSIFVLMQYRDVGFIDCRPNQDFELDHIINAYNISITKLISDEFLPTITEKEIWVLYDNDGNIAELRIAAHSLSQHGSKNIFILFGGYHSWLEKNYPTELGEAL